MSKCLPNVLNLCNERIVPPLSLIAGVNTKCNLDKNMKLPLLKIKQSYFRDILSSTFLSTSIQ